MTDRAAGAWLDFSGKVCVVTGAGGGIGRAIAESFAAAGGKVAVLDVNAEGCAETAARIKAAGGQGLAVRCDVSEAGSVDAAGGAVGKTFGPCDILVNNAGIIRKGRLESVSVAEWDKLIGINLRGYLLCSQQFVPSMLERGRGAIVHVASIAATEPHPFCSAYSVSKAGVAMLSQQMAIEWGPRGVRSNSVSPGLVRTPLSQAFYDQPGVTEKRIAVVPSRRIGVPQDVADPVLFLASDRASYINGHDLIIDGGLARSVINQIPQPGYAD